MPGPDGMLGTDDDVVQRLTTFTRASPHLRREQRSAGDSRHDPLLGRAAPAAIPAADVRLRVLLGAWLHAMGFRSTRPPARVHPGRVAGVDRRHAARARRHRRGDDQAMRASETAKAVTGMNSNLRVGMDMMARDFIQTGQGLPTGRVVSMPNGAGARADRAARPSGHGVYVRRRVARALSRHAGPGPRTDGQRAADRHGHRHRGGQFLREPVV